MEWQRLSQRTYYRGRVALYAILRAMGVGPGDEVATQAFTCVAVPEAILACGARPVYVDIDPAGYNLDPSDLQRKLSPRTRALVVQHTFGIPAAMSEIVPFAQRAGLPLIEDCCHTFLSTVDERPVGTFGVASFYSFEWGKPLVIGVGGSAVANDPDLARRLGDAYPAFLPPPWQSQLKLEIQRWVHRTLYRPAFYWPLRAAFRRLSRLGAAEGNYHPVQSEGAVAKDFSLCMSPRLTRRLAKKLSELEQHAEHSRALVSELERTIPPQNAVRPQLPPAAQPVYARYPLRVADKPRLLAKAREQNVELADWYSTPVHPLGPEQAGAVYYEPASCPCAEARVREIVSLPLHRRVGRSYVDKVGELFQKAA